MNLDAFFWYRYTYVRTAAAAIAELKILFAYGTQQSILNYTVVGSPKLTPTTRDNMVATH